MDEIERRKLEAEEKRKQEEEEAAQKKFIGTRVTVESFLQWKEKFDAELEALKSQKQKELEAAMKAKLSFSIILSVYYALVSVYGQIPGIIGLKRPYHLVTYKKVD